MTSSEDDVGKGARACKSDPAMQSRGRLRNGNVEDACFRETAQSVLRCALRGFGARDWSRTSTPSRETDFHPTTAFAAA